MALSFPYALKTSLRKYRRKPFRTVLGLIPTVLLTIVIVIMSSLALSIDLFVKNRILAKVESREQIIKLNKLSRSNGGSMPMAADTSGTSSEVVAYSPDEISKLGSIKHVKAVDPVRSLPPLLGASSDVVGEAVLYLSDVKAAPVSLGKSYGASSFDYRAGDPAIPIILSRNFFVEEKIDWAGKDTITISEKDTQNPSRYQELSPIKRRFLSEKYDKQQLLGHTFTVQYRQLPAIPSGSVKSNSTATGYTETYRKYTDAEYTKLTQDQVATVGPYWNYEALAKGLTVRYKIVGFDEDIDSYTSYIPEPAVLSIMQQLYDSQAKARTAKTLPGGQEQTGFMGWAVTQGGSIQNNLFINEYSAAPLTREEPDEKGRSGLRASIYIPGFVFKLTLDEKTEPLEQKGYKITANQLPAANVTIVIDDAANRSVVEKALIDAGFAEASSQFSITKMLRSAGAGLNTALMWIVGVLGVINALLLIISVGRSVSDAQREIGVYRALGARRRDIRFLYVVFAALQTAIGVGIGIAAGLLLLLPLGSFLAGQLNSLLRGGIVPDLGFNLSVASADLLNVDAGRVLLYGTALVLITAVISLIPAAKAARISPIEAIRKAD